MRLERELMGCDGMGCDGIGSDVMRCVDVLGCGQYLEKFHSFNCYRKTALKICTRIRLVLQEDSAGELMIPR